MRTTGGIINQNSPRRSNAGAIAPCDVDRVNFVASLFRASVGPVATKS
jgi:hypothetical protein